jgi:hypothetical protein
MSTQTRFPVFEDNQVLTSHQLNELRIFLDEDNRLTRTKLIGIGTAFGMKVAFIGTTNEIAISCGTGTTSEGYLITLGDCLTNRYRPYTLPVNSPYAPFMNGAVQDVTLYEMLTSASAIDTNIDVMYTAAPGGITSFLSDKAVVLFVEWADIIGDSCLGRKCDELGIDRTFTLRKLLVNFDDLDQIIFRSTGALSDPLYPTKFNLDDVIMRRVLFNPALAESKNYTDFSLNFARAFRTDIFTNIFNQLQDTYDVYKPILDIAYNGVNPFLDNSVTTLISSWTNYLNGAALGGGSPYFGMQYFYDFIKDLILAYDEFSVTAFELASECCINMTRFPRHLMIGEVIPTGNPGPSKYRQEFIYSRLHDDQKILWEKTIMLHKRIVLLLKSFDFTLVNDPLSTTIIRITPSYEKKSFLSERAIPFYYQHKNPYPLTSLSSAISDQLQKNWNYDSIRKNKISGTVVQLQAYWNQHVNQLVDRDSVQTPFYYNLDPYNFLRIEGHFKKSYTTVLDDPAFGLNVLKARFDLPFNVVALRLQGKAFDDVEARCNFEDLRSQYAAIRAGFLCKLDNVSGRIQLELNPSSFFKHVITDADAVSNNSSVEFRPPVPVSFSAPVEVGSDSSDSFAGRMSTPNPTFTFTAPTPQPGTSVLNRDKPLDTLIKDYNSNITSLNGKLANLKSLLPFEFKNFDYGADIASIDQSFIKTWIDAVNFAFTCKISFSRILDFIRNNTKTQFTKELYFILSHYTTEVLTLFNNFVQDCTYKQFEQVFYTYQYRVNYLIDHDPQLFSNFIKKHPGIEHKAGVQMGGTFIIVYNGDNITVDIKKNEHLVLVASNVAALTCRKTVLETKPVRTVGETIELSDINFQLTQCFNLNAQFIANEAPPISIQQVKVEPHEVIADFSLPYLCCCDCDCGEIPPPAEADLKLPTNVFVPVFYDFNMGDYAFGTTITRSIEGCTISVSTLTITADEIKKKIQYDPSNSILRLRFIENGIAHPHNDIATNTSPPTVLDAVGTTGGTAQIITSGTSQGFRYTPHANFVGLDSFNFIFEIFSTTGAIRLASTQGTIVINVTCQCDVVPPIEQVEILPDPSTTENT